MFHMLRGESFEVEKYLKFLIARTFLVHLYELLSLLSKSHSKQFNSMCQLQWISHCFSALFFNTRPLSWVFYLFTKILVCYSLWVIFKFARDMKKIFALFVTNESRENEEKKSLKLPSTHRGRKILVEMQIECPSSFLHVIAMQHTTLVGWLSEREEGRKVGRFFTFTSFSSPSRTSFFFV